MDDQACSIDKNEEERGNLERKRLNCSADQIIKFLEKIQQQEEIKCKQKKTLCDKLGVKIEDFDESVLKQLNEVSELQYQLGCADNSHTSLILHDVDHKAESLKLKRQVNQLKIEIKKVTKVTDETTRLTKTLQRDYEVLQEDGKMLKVDLTEEKELVERIRRYKAVIKKLEDDFRTLKLSDTSVVKYDQDIENLRNLQRKQEELSEKLSKYMGASPELDTLRKQVEEVEVEYKEYQLKFSNLL